MRRIEPDAALGNGGLGRLAACFMDSMATLSIAAHGYGIRYDNGLFRQIIRGGWQQETPEDWLVNGNPWEFVRPEYNYAIGFGGWVEMIQGDDERARHVWHPAETVEAVAYDTPIVGWRGRHVNTLRLWSARATDPLKLEAFNAGDYVGAFSETVRAEAISKVLYPSDATPAGQELRLRQEYFFASASLLDLIRRHIKQYGDVRTLGEHAAVQLNDTHPAIGIAELMRILVDLNKVEWDEAWSITQAIFSYTNHTLLPEALETWPVPLMERVLPRHMQIIYLINAAHLDSARRRGFVDQGLLAVDFDDRRARRPAGANGQPRLHRLAQDQRRFGAPHRPDAQDRVPCPQCGLSRPHHQQDQRHHLPPLADRVQSGARRHHSLDPRRAGARRLWGAEGPCRARRRSRRAGAAWLRRDKSCKAALARTIADQLNQRVDPDAMFDVQVKRIHEYKRQLLNILETVARYNAIRANPTIDFAPRVKIFAGKAAASYTQAKLIIKLAIDVARVVNSDPTVRGLLKVVFLPNYNVSLAEMIMPAADLSEQISTAGMEASGTGNMKMALNGALTVGTLDGANVEMRDLVGDDNIFIFGLTAAEVEASRAQGIDSTARIAASPILREALDEIGSGVFSTDDAARYRGLVDTLTHHDYFMVCADFDAYWATQMKIDEAWRDRRRWMRSSILNTANVGWFSSDRTIAEYAKEIWNAPFAPIS